MPNYSIQGPDGKTYSIDGPEGASREQVIDAIQAKLSAPLVEAPKAAEDPNNGWIPTWEQMKHEGFAGRLITGEGMPKQPGEEGQPTPTCGLIS